MIKSWKNRDLRDFFETGRARRIDTKLQRRIAARLTALNQAKGLPDLNIHGYELHKWSGAYVNKWSISVSGHWRITFTWINGDAHDVDLEQPHP
ncbi:type II toxin-antitoxin system RelE/ParE family toxin [Bradyrhizobium sp.]|uniref:type II toxin-antitoxin system RelE/ParE family toxin n=1 Tax=Bradyrhizobium sp. TaxID=376 RepID=UPI0025B9ECB0|nr:type II toxin-antitoxin system RelE/ParE family toxin [Bradyrhizobium sp.]